MDTKQEKQNIGPENEKLMPQQPSAYPPPQQYAPPPQYVQVSQSYPPGQPSAAYSHGTVYVDPKGQPVQPSYGQNVVVTQPVVTTGPVVVQRPQNWMIPSILACLFCFCPTGVFAIYYAKQANDYADEMNMAEAERANRTARNLVIASVIVGVCWVVLVIVLRLVVFATHYSMHGY